MTIEFSLRRRSSHARFMAVLWLALATLILIGTYLSLPMIAAKTLSIVRNIESESVGDKPGPQGADKAAPPRIELYAVGVLALSLLPIGFACFLLGRTAFVEIELAARFAGFADALCISGENFDQLEKAANLMVPGTKYLSVPEIFSIKDVGSALELLKEMKPR